MKVTSRFINSLWLVSLLVTAPFAHATIDPDKLFQPLSPMPEHASTTKNIVDALASRHYVVLPLDDKMSSEIFDKYIDSLDPNRSYFYAADIAEFEQYRYELDNSLRTGKLKIGYRIFNRYLERIRERYEFVINLLETKYDQFDFTKKEQIAFNREEAPWIDSKTVMQELWYKRAKNDVLNLRLAKKETVKTKVDQKELSDPELPNSALAKSGLPEEERNKIQELLLKRYKNRLTRAGQTNSEDVYQVYMNAFTRSYDPHTQYFSPRSSENFNINMSLSLEGIGAVLQRDEEFTKVVSLIHAGPAEKSNQLSPNDKIIAVGQGVDGEMIDIIGWRLDEVVEQIRGKKDTIVRLNVIPAGAIDNSESKIVQLTRNKVKIEEQSAKSEIIEIEQDGTLHKIGVIQIPTFYIDFNALQEGDPNYKSTTRDVSKLLVDLQRDGVEGVVIDLRDNGGGSLQEANSLTGLFIDRGPTVQIRSKRNRVDVLNDRDFRTIYGGPLAVLVNRLSASASEIFAGAIQDYERGVIIGSQTFGKGTVQSLIPLNRGQLKLTQAKFYRISGESTQHQGIIPDILYPERHDPEAIGESTLDDPLPWDRINATGYKTKSNIAEILPNIRNLHLARASFNPDFEFLKKAINFRREQEKDETISLNEQDRVDEKAENEEFWTAIENEKRRAKGLPEIESLDDLNPDNTVASAPAAGMSSASENEDGTSEQGGNLEGNEMAGLIDATQAIETAQPLAPKGSSESSLSKEKEEKKDKEPDAYLTETGHILLDMTSMGERAVAAKAIDRTI